MRGVALIGTQDNPAETDSPTQLMDFNLMGNDLFNQGQYKEAIVEYTRALGMKYGLRTC
jgi:hypothetical protein